MDSLNWECCESILNNGTYGIVENGPLRGPIKAFAIRRNEDLQLIFETLSAANSTSTYQDQPAGSVYVPDAEVRLECFNGAVAVASGVIPIGYSQKWDTTGDGETKETSRCSELKWRDASGKPAKYLVEWYENMPKDVGWPDLDKYTETTSATRVLQGGAERIQQTSSVERIESSRSCIHLCVQGMRVVVGTSKACLESVKRPGYILYVGTPAEETRRKIRDCLSYCLGNYLIFLGATSFDETWVPVAFTAKSCYALVSEVDRLQGRVPSPLGLEFEPQLTEERLTPLLTGLLKIYDTYRLGTVFWNYWHSVSAPVHMAAAHMGATIEGLQKMWYGHDLGASNSRLVEHDAEWRILRERLCECIAWANLPEDVKVILKGKVKGLNTAPQNVLMERFLGALDLKTGELEKAAWRNRNRAAHGASTESMDLIRLIRENKLLAVLFHRIVLALAGSDLYYDYYTLGRPIRRLRDAPVDDRNL